MSLKLKALTEPSAEPNPNPNGSAVKRLTFDLGSGSEVVYIPKFFPFNQAWNWFDYLNNEIPWARPTIRVFGRSCVQVPPPLPAQFNQFRFSPDFLFVCLCEIVAKRKGKKRISYFFSIEILYNCIQINRSVFCELK